MQKIRPTYTFDVDGHTVVTPVKEPEWECKCKASQQNWKEIDRFNTVNWLFGLFKGIAFGECIAIAATLLAQLYIIMPSSSIGLMTQFYYWAIRTFGGETMICVWIIIGMLLTWAFDHTGIEATV